ncbi:hypothetical protein BASA83_005165 [Batrachochytrium salamandrivorans]|nr:hypothetical protein BASA83_005165 [Batrachochytrium salamandrivorans]
MRVGIGIILSVLSSSVLAAVIPNDDDHGLLLARRTGSLENKDLLWKRADEEQMELGSSNSGAGASTEASAGASAGDDAEASTSTGESNPNNSRSKSRLSKMGRSFRNFRKNLKTAKQEVALEHDKKHLQNAIKALTKVTESDDKSGFILEVETLLRTALNEARGFMKAFKKVKKPFVLFTPEGKNRKSLIKKIAEMPKTAKKAVEKHLKDLYRFLAYIKRHPKTVLSELKKTINSISRMNRMTISLHERVYRILTLAVKSTNNEENIKVTDDYMLQMKDHWNRAFDALEVIKRKVKIDRTTQSARRSCVEELREERRLSARFVAFNCLCFLQNSQGRVAWLKQADLVSEISIAELDARSVFLGLDEQVGLPYWAVDVTNCQSLISKLETQLCLGKFVEARPAAFDLPRFEASIVGQARSLIDWNARYIYCPSCGSKTKQAESGHKRLCLDQKCISHSSVQNYSHPRTDAAVIIAVSSVDGNRILLGRQKDWPERVYSCIAGFLECGESIDEACKREVNEETNVQVGSVLFHSSQPWPFPSQLMLGCFGQAVSDEIKLKDGELQDARWFTRDEIGAAISGKSAILRLSTKGSIAFSLVRAWLERGSTKSAL